MKPIIHLAVSTALTLVGMPVLAAASKPAIMKWTSGDDDYPKSAFVHHQEGTTLFSVTVGTDGRARDCMITKSSGSADLDEATCKAVLKRARFTPATDEHGMPIEAPFSSRMNWRFPR